MKSTTLLLAFFALALLQIGCVEKCPTTDTPEVPSGSATIHLKAVWDGAPYVLNTRRAFHADDSIKLDEVLFFMSDITLLGTDKTGVLSDIALVSLSNAHQTLAGAQVGESVNCKNKVPVATYNTLRFGLGVSPALNATQPSQYNSSNPLSNTDLFWSSQRYVFSRISGKTQLATGGAFTSWVYHTGTDAMYKTVSVSIPNTAITANGTTDITLTLDLKKLFIKGSDTITLGAYQNPDNAQQRPVLDAWNNSLVGAFR
jgi:hypothetical protein